MRILTFNFRFIGQAIVLCAVAVTGCSFFSPQHVADTPTTVSQSRTTYPNMPLGARAADIAAQQVSVPYRWGGNSPQGFDCSGLVHYSYAQVGVTVPRTTRDQRHATRRIDIAAAEPGDLLFFKTWRKGWHVALYLGNGEFVHAPSTGKRVAVANLNNEYYRKHLVRVGRLYDMQ